MTDTIGEPVTGSRSGQNKMRPMLFMLHFLGGSVRTWDAVARRLPQDLDCRGIDLPGFGDASAVGAWSVDEMADHVAALIQAAAPHRWMIAGHSMGAKVAMAVARRAEDGAPGLGGLEGVVLLAGSPAGPEPMDDERRRIMLTWFRGDADAARREADGFIRQSVGAPLEPAEQDRAVDDVLRMNRSAWRAWLEQGSREDWSRKVGTLRTPAVIVAGEYDDDLGTATQRRLTLPHFADASLHTLRGAGHLLPVERPDEVADLILGLAGIDSSSEAMPLDPAYLALLRSDRVSARTRAVLLDRAKIDDPDRSAAVLSPDLFAVLHAAVRRIVPQRSSPEIDLAARIDEDLASGAGDGWRFAELPPDAEAYRRGLATLDAEARAAHRHGFAELDGARQDQLLRRMAEGSLGHEAARIADHLAPAQMKLWFEDLRAGATRIYVAHPATLARIGYSGIANGGDGPRKQGFVLTGAGQREDWEPVGVVRAPA